MGAAGRCTSLHVAVLEWGPCEKRCRWTLDFGTWDPFNCWIVAPFADNPA